MHVHYIQISKYSINVLKYFYFTFSKTRNRPQLGSGRGSVMIGHLKKASKIFTLQRDNDNYAERIITPENQVQTLKQDYIDYHSYYGSPERKWGRTRRIKPKYEVEFISPVELIHRSPAGRFILCDEFIGYARQEPYIDDIIINPDVRTAQDNIKTRQDGNDDMCDIDFNDYAYNPYRPENYELPHWENNLQPQFTPAETAEEDPCTTLDRSKDSSNGEPRRASYDRGLGTYRNISPDHMARHDGVIIRPPASIPRSTPSRPDPHNWTFMTSSPDPQDGYSQPFIVSDLSSVLPSSANGTQSNSVMQHEVSSGLAKQNIYSPKFDIPSFNEGADSALIPQSSIPYQTGYSYNFGKPDDEAHSRTPSNDIVQEELSPASSKEVTPQNNSNGSREFAYTRDRLGQAIQIARNPQLRKLLEDSQDELQHSGSDRHDSLRPSPSITAPDSSQHSRQNSAHSYDKSGPFAVNVAPYKKYTDRTSMTSSSGWGSGSGLLARLGRQVSAQSNSLFGQHSSLGSSNLTSQSSGLGSRETSSSHPGGLGPARYPRKSTSSSWSGPSLSTFEPDTIFESPPDNHMHDREPVHERQHSAASENYNFDPELLEEHLMDTLRNKRYPYDADMYPHKKTGAMTSSGDLSPLAYELYPKPKRDSLYDKSEERCAKLREEYKAFQMGDRAYSQFGGYQNGNIAESEC